MSHFGNSSKTISGVLIYILSQSEDQRPKTFMNQSGKPAADTVPIQKLTF